MMDEATLIGGVAALAGCGCGIGACLFMEYSAERTEEKGTLTEEVICRFFGCVFPAAMFLSRVVR